MLLKYVYHRCLFYNLIKLRWLKTRSLKGFSYFGVNFELKSDHSRAIVVWSKIKKQTAVISILNLYIFWLRFDVSYTTLFLPRSQTSLSLRKWWARKGGREGERMRDAFRLSPFSFPWSLACSSPVSRASSSPASPVLRLKSKRLRRKQTLFIITIVVRGLEPRLSDVDIDNWLKFLRVSLILQW